MRIDNWAYIDPSKKMKIRNIIENEIKSGKLLKYVADYSDSFIRFDLSKNKSGFTGQLCDSERNVIHKFNLDSEFNFNWSISII